MKKNLIALVATAVLIGGERTVIQPGQRLPDLSPHDEHELLASRAIKDSTSEDADQAAAQAAELAGQAEFQAARGAVIAQQESIGDPAAGDAAAATSAPAKTAAAAKKK